MGKVLLDFFLYLQKEEKDQATIYKNPSKFLFTSEHVLSNKISKKNTNNTRNEFR